jgi:hypothetical protein
MSSFYPNQIVCLSCQDNALYSEVIQVIPDRSSLWVRPLFFVLEGNDDSIDARDSSDLILPIELFRPALDTEVIPIFSQLIQENYSNKSRPCLQYFVQQVWQNNPSFFKN